MPDWIPRDWTLQTAYAFCALVGGGVVVVQLLLSLLGLGGDESDIDVDLEGDAGLHLFSVRTVSAFLTVFGLVGWIGTLEGWPRPLTFGVAFVSASSVLLVVAMLLRMQARLTMSGNIDSSGAVGKTARVYLRVPGNGEGTGKITVVLQGRTAEYTAFTRGETLPTGSEVRVVRMTNPGTFEVEKLGQEA